MVIELLMALSILWFFAFSSYCAYMRLIGRKGDSKEILGNIIWNYGAVVIVATIACGICVLSFIFCNWILISLGLNSFLR